MSADTEENFPDTGDLLTLSRVGTWVVVFSGVAAVAVSLISSFTGPPTNIELLFFSITCVFLILCFSLLHKVTQVLRRMEEQMEKYRIEQEET